MTSRMSMLGFASGLAAMLALAGPAALAEEFLGEDGESGDAVQPGDEDLPKVEKPAKKKKKAKRAMKRREDDEDDEDDDAPVSAGAGEWAISGGLGAGKGYVSGQVTVGYYFNRYVGIDTTFTYDTFDNEDTAGEQYGPEVDLVLRAANPTPVTPFVGVGPGYVKWVRRIDDEIFDDSAAPTGNAFAGIHVGLTKHFGIQAVRKQTMWLGDPPRRFLEPEEREAKTTITTNIGFHVSF